MNTYNIELCMLVIGSKNVYLKYKSVWEKLILSRLPLPHHRLGYHRHRLHLRSSRGLLLHHQLGLQHPPHPKFRRSHLIDLHHHYVIRRVHLCELNHGELHFVQGREQLIVKHSVLLALVVITQVVVIIVV